MSARLIHGKSSRSACSVSSFSRSARPIQADEQPWSLRSKRLKRNWTHSINAIRPQADFLVSGCSGIRARISRITSLKGLLHQEKATLNGCWFVRLLRRCSTRCAQTAASWPAARVSAEHVRCSRVQGGLRPTQSRPQRLLPSALPCPCTPWPRARHRHGSAPG
jgi:hypothetical protein